MKTIGMIGSVSWQATIDYYRIINEVIAQKLGGHHSAKIYMACTDFEILVQLAMSEPVRRSEAEQCVSICSPWCRRCISISMEYQAVMLLAGWHISCFSN